MDAFCIQKIKKCASVSQRTENADPCRQTSQIKPSIPLHPNSVEPAILPNSVRIRICKKEYSYPLGYILGFILLRCFGIYIVSLSF